MPAKNMSAVQKLTRFLHLGQRQYSRRTILQKAGKDPFGISNYSIIDKRSWPKREDAYAAIQLEVQTRNLSSVRKIGNSFTMALAQAKRGVVPKRNNILAKRNAKKNIAKTEYLSKMASLARQEVERLKQPRAAQQSTTTTSLGANANANTNANEYYRISGRTHQNRNQQQKRQHEQQQRNQSEEKYDQAERQERGNLAQGQQSRQHQGRDKFDDEMEPQTLRDVVFGIPDNNEEDSKLQLEADNELLKRLSQQRPILDRPSIVSKRVIAPYQTYNSHRNSWAEFRYRMIYG